jgi:hypothetical protein
MSGAGGLSRAYSLAVAQLGGAAPFVGGLVVLFVVRALVRVLPLLSPLSLLVEGLSSLAGFVASAAFFGLGLHALGLVAGGRARAVNREDRHLRGGGGGGEEAVDTVATAALCDPAGGRGVGGAGPAAATTTVAAAAAGGGSEAAAATAAVGGGDAAYMPRAGGPAAAAARVSPAAILAENWGVPREVARELEPVVGYVRRDFIDGWYSGLCAGEEGGSGFPAEVSRALAHALGALSARAARLKLLLYLLHDVPEALRLHLAWFRVMQVRARPRVCGWVRGWVVGVVVVVVCR